MKEVKFSYLCNSWVYGELNKHGRVSTHLTNFYFSTESPKDYTSWFKGKNAITCEPFPSFIFDRYSL